MTTDIAVAVIAFAGTALGTFGGILSSAKLTNFRIKQLEIKVDRHNNFAERIPVVERDIQVLCHRVEDLEIITRKG